jgi:uridine kinase
MDSRLLFSERLIDYKYNADCSIQIRTFIESNMANIPRSTLVGLAGGSASGKSTFSQALVKCLQTGLPEISVDVISTDRYFLPDDKIPRFVSPSTGLETPDYNRPDSIDVGRLLDDMDQRCQATDHPSVLLVEGLMVLHLAEVRERLDLRLFIELEGEKRALRRLVRNIGHTYDPITQHDPQSIATYYLESAYIGHHQYIEPSRIYADLTLRGDSDFNRTAPMLAAVIRQQVMIHSTH